MSWAGAATAAVGLVSAISGSKSASKAASAQKAALDQQSAIANRQLDMAEETYQRYLDLYAPVEEQYLQDAQRPVPYEALAGRAEATVGKEYDAQGEALSRELARYGVSPASQRGMALKQDASLSEAAARANAANQARAVGDATQKASIENVLNYGKGMPMSAQSGLNQAGTAMSGVASAYGNLYSSINKNTSDTVGGLAGLYGYAKEQGWLKPSTPTTTSAPAGSGATQPHYGFGVGVANWAEGGAVPSPTASALGVADTVPGVLSEGEYVIPADVVRRKGTDFFDRMIGKDGNKKQGAL